MSFQNNFKDNIVDAERVVVFSAKLLFACVHKGKSKSTWDSFQTWELSSPDVWEMMLTFKNFKCLLKTWTKNNKGLNKEKLQCWEHRTKLPCAYLQNGCSAFYTPLLKSCQSTPSLPTIGGGFSFATWLEVRCCYKSSLFPKCPYARGTGQSHRGKWGLWDNREHLNNKSQWHNYASIKLSLTYT